MGLSSAELELADSQAESWGPGYQLNVMFLCMHNSCRSQMADGWMRKLRESSRVGVASAGIKDGTMVKEGAIRVMAEVGVDLSSFSSNALTEFSPERFDVVVSCCACGDHLSGPLQAWKQRKLFLDWSLDGPEKLDPGDYSVYRRVREETREKCAELLALLEEGCRADHVGCSAYESASCSAVVSCRPTCIGFFLSSSLLRHSSGVYFRLPAWPPTRRIDRARRRKSAS